jgi:hypothetical protein
MKPKTINLITALALCTLSQTCRAQDDPPFSTRVTVSIADDDKIPVAGADVLIAYLHAYDGKRDRKHEGQTDAAGHYEAKDRVNGSVLLRASKDGHYPLDFERVLIRMNVDWQKIKNIELPLVMRQIKQPVPLFAKKFAAAVPVFDKPVGFDFKAGDWVAPHGKGKSPDIVFNCSKHFIGYRFEESQLGEMREFSKKSYAVNGDFWSEDEFKISAGKWDGKTSITFPHPQEGIANAAKDYCHYSALTLPHQAYWKGYSESLIMVTDNYTPKNTPPVPAYFVRTRVILDDKGKIISANYAKITSPIYFDPRGRIEFTYVFNPTPNDRNLEFDTNRNLFGELNLEQRVTAP